MAVFVLHQKGYAYIASSEYPGEDVSGEKQYFFAVDSVEDPVAQASKYSSGVQGLMSMPVAIFNKLKEDYRQIKESRGKDPFNWFEKVFGLPHLMKKKSAALRNMIARQYSRERQRQNRSRRPGGRR